MTQRRRQVRPRPPEIATGPHAPVHHRHPRHPATLVSAAHRQQYDGCSRRKPGRLPTSETITARTTASRCEQPAAPARMRRQRRRADPMPRTTWWDPAVLCPGGRVTGGPSFRTPRDPSAPGDETRHSGARQRHCGPRDAYDDDLLREVLDDNSLVGSVTTHTAFACDDAPEDVPAPELASRREGRVHSTTRRTPGGRADLHAHRHRLTHSGRARLARAPRQVRRDDAQFASRQGADAHRFEPGRGAARVSVERRALVRRGAVGRAQIAVGRAAIHSNPGQPRNLGPAGCIRRHADRTRRSASGVAGTVPCVPETIRVVCEIPW